MDNRTMINRQLRISIPTVVNTKLVAEKNKKGNPATQQIKEGTQIGEAIHYTIKQKMEGVSGEADLYLCATANQKPVVAKIYKREDPLKKGVIDKIKSIRSPYVASIQDTFTWNGRTVIILPYYKNGSLSGKKFTYEELRKNIIPSINEGLKAIHDKKLLHKDLKPANIMLNDDRRSISIIDFGISSILEDGNTVLLTKTGMTPVYSAPELFNGLALVEADYYSFGITLYELYCGSTPYAGLSDAEIAKFTSIQRIPLPKQMPAPLKQLINALTYPDITNRNKKGNPNRRWTYDEVMKWLNGEELPSPGGYDAVEITPFPFQGKLYTKVSDLLEAMGLNWDAGKKVVFHGTLASHVKSSNLELYEYCSEAIQEASAHTGKDDTVFFRFLYQASPEMKAIYWKGRRFESLPAFGRTMLESLWREDTSQYRLYDSILSEKVLSAYVSVRASDNASLLETIKKMEILWATMKEEKRDLRLAYYLMAYLLSNQVILKIEDEEIRTISELSEFMNSKLNINIKALIDTTHKLVDYNGALNVQLEAWLMALGKQNEIERWRELLQIGGDQT